MNIKVLGTGCRNCELVYRSVLQAVEELGRTDITIEYVKDISQISKYVMMTPGIAIDEVVVHVGKPLPNVEQIKKMITEFTK
ncbi:MAG: thioredoxin family protein [Deferribacterales bacterium]